jgi:hypothetical protein
MRQIINISILLLLVFGSEVLGFSHQVDLPIYPDSSDSSCEDDNLNKAMESCIPKLSRLTPNGASILPNQEVLISIFRPPRSIF